VSQAAIFRTRTLAAAIAVGAVGFVMMIGSMAIDRTEWGYDPGPNAYSTSALGHKAFLELLRQLEIPVLVSRADTPERIDWNSILLILEPDGEHDTRIEALLDAAAKVDAPTLYVLPKRTGIADPFAERWVGVTDMLDESRVRAALRLIDPNGDVVRSDAARVRAFDAFGWSPRIDSPQLITSPNLSTVVGDGNGVLLGRVDRGAGTVWVLSDPDLLATHGLVADQNAEIAVALVELLRWDDAVIVVDETHHGLEVPRSLLGRLLHVPLIVPTTQAILAVLLLLWATGIRFGPISRPSPPLRPGKVELIDNIADLLLFGGYSRQIVERYRIATIDYLSRVFHLPANVTSDERVARLDALSKRRGIPAPELLSRPIPTTLRAKDGNAKTSLVTDAHRLYTWRQEMIDGFGRTRRPYDAAARRNR